MLLRRVIVPIGLWRSFIIHFFRFPACHLVNRPVRTTHEWSGTVRVVLVAVVFVIIVKFIGVVDIALIPVFITVITTIGPLKFVVGMRVGASF